MRTDVSALRRGPADSLGYRRLVAVPGEPHVVRHDLLATAPDGEPLLTVAHLSDLHLCDAQSPARVEFLDRWADPDSPLLPQLQQVGTYRAQELLTAQVAEAAVQSVNALRGVDLALVTGDATDNAQANEVDWYLRLLEGGIVHPDSGDFTRWEGVADDTDLDERFWHPGGPAADLPRIRYGLPGVPGLLDAARRAFPATGLEVPWLAVHGNHDRMLQGTVPSTGPLAKASTGPFKPVAVPTHWTTDAVLRLLQGLESCATDAVAALAGMTMRLVSPDAQRRCVSRSEFVGAHFGPLARPLGHGFDVAGGTTGRAYYRHDHGPVTILALDTVNDSGGWQGSLDEPQLAWLETELAAADTERRYVVLASHHPLHTLVNDRSDSGRRVLSQELSRVLNRHRSVVLWLNGHTHHTTAAPHKHFWEVTAPSLIDWPQQTRLVSLDRAASGSLTITVTMVDHAAPPAWTGQLDFPLELAALSRELAANDWQWRGHHVDAHPRAGKSDERNAHLLLPDPWP